MRMKRWISLAMAAVLALAVAGIAVAHKNGGQPQSTDQVSATFTATPDPNKTATRECTGVDGTYAITKSVANGTTVSDDARLAGNIKIKSKSVVNTTTGRGWSEGKVFTTDPATGKPKGVSDFTAVVTGGNKLEGFVIGKVKTPAAAPSTPKAKKGRKGHRHGQPNSTLRANFSAEVDPSGAIAGGLGTGGGDNTAIIHGNPCAPAERAQNAPHGQNEGRHGDGERKGGRDDR